jgi:uncharacterized protein (DUF1499 family)
MLFTTPPRPVSRLARWAERLAWLSLPIILVAVLLVRARMLAVESGLLILLAGVVIAAAAISVATVAALEIWRKGYSGLAALARALLVATLVLAWPGYLAVQALRLPVLNDITTSIEDPPLFSRSQAAFAAREGRTPPVVDRATRERQRSAYPQVRTIVLDNEPAEAFQLVQRAVRVLKWQVIEESAPDERRGIGRIEAIDETFLMRFRDDITIRLRWTGSQTRIDIRSASRVGRHDFGANARRILRLAEEINNPEG